MKREDLLKLLVECDVSNTGDISVDFGIGNITLDRAVKDLISMAIESDENISEETKNSFILAYNEDDYINVLNLIKQDLTISN